MDKTIKCVTCSEQLTTHNTIHVFAANFCSKCFAEFSQFFVKEVDAINNKFVIGKLFGFTSDRIKAGLDRARQQGKKLGKPRKVTKEMAEKIISLRADGLSLRAIAKELNIGGTTVYDENKRTSTKLVLNVLNDQNKYLQQTKENLCQSP